MNILRGDDTDNKSIRKIENVQFSSKRLNSLRIFLALLGGLKEKLEIPKGKLGDP